MHFKSLYYAHLSSPHITETNPILNQRRAKKKKSANSTSRSDRLRARCKNSEVDLERDDKSPTRCKIAWLSWKSLEAISVCRQIRMWAPLFVTLCRRQSFGGAQRAHSAARAEISFRHRCHLSRGAWDTQDRRGNIPQPDIAQVRVATRRETKTQHWSEMKQPPELNH